MKRFHVFAGDQYYPSSGLGDYKNSFNTLAEAEQYLESYHGRPDWWSIVESVEDGLKEVDSWWDPQ